MGEQFQNYSRIQDFEAASLWKVSLEIMNKADYNSFSDLLYVYQKTSEHLNLKLLIFHRHTASFKI